MEAAREYLEAFLAGGYGAIQATVSERRVEDLHLDFKLLANGGPPLTRDDRRALADALSGFSNADGGVIVWGVDARKGEDEADTAQELRPIAELKRFRSDLEGLTAQLAAPAPGGVEHLEIEDPGQRDKGFVVTYVPKSEGEPVMAMGPKQRGYVLRVGSSFLPMEHFQIADRFHRRPPPKIAFSCSLAPGGSGGGPRGRAASVYVNMGITNDGRGLATHPMLVVQPLVKFDRETCAWSENGNGLPKRILGDTHSEFRSYAFASTSYEAVHPGTSLHVCALYLHIGETAKPGPIRINYEAYCDGDAKRGSHIVDGSDLERMRDLILKK